MGFLTNFAAEQKKVAWAELTARGLDSLFFRLFQMYNGKNPEIVHRTSLLLIQLSWIVGRSELPAHVEESFLDDDSLYAYPLLQERRKELATPPQVHTTKIYIPLSLSLSRIFIYYSRTKLRKKIPQKLIYRWS